MNLGKIIAVIGEEITKDIIAEQQGEEAVKKRNELKKEKRNTGMLICGSLLFIFILIAISL